MNRPWQPPPTIDEFRLERLLGQGSSADVWLARDTLLDRPVALKLASAPATLELRVSFRVEARAVARLQHPNLLTVHHVGEVEDRPFLVVELLSGASLDRVERPVAPDRVLSIGIGLARGLAAAHRAGVVHCDIKPANAFLCDDGTAKLLDFGLAKLGDPAAAAPRARARAFSALHGDTEDRLITALADTVDSRRYDETQSPWSGATLSPTSNKIVGTPLYMAPEVWEGEPATRRADVYGFGALLFELLSGRPPYQARSFRDFSANVLTGKLPDLAALAPSAPVPLVSLVTRCLARAPDERPRAEEVRDALEAIAEPRLHLSEVPADPEANPYRGLLSFGAEHKALFFGREAETATAVEELRSAPFVLVVAPSGAGKSSLVRAGVLPRVRAGALGPGVWRTPTMVPGARPAEALAKATAPVGDDAKVVLFVDQLEEIWTLAPAAERARFVEALTALAGTMPRARIVATLRSDFLERVGELGELRTLALRAPVMLGPMTPGGVRRAVVEPARRSGVEIEPALADRLTEMGGAGSLPLLEFALSVLWTKRAEGALTLTGLDAIGGIEGALAAHADAALARLSPRLQSEARRMLLALVTVDRTRARRDEADLAGNTTDARAALDALVEARLVVASAGESGAAYDIAHEALLSGWPTLHRWLEEDAAGRQEAERVRRAAAEWERLGRADDALFDLAALDQLSLSTDGALGARETAFLQASHAAVRRGRARRRVALGLVPLFLVAASAGTWIASAASHRAAVAGALGEARALAEKADGVARAATDLHARAIAEFDRDELGPAEETWKASLAGDDAADAARRQAGEALDRALSLDSKNAEARARSADVLYERLLSAEQLHDDALATSLRARLELYDDGTRAERLGAAGHVELSTDPPGATLTLARVAEDDSGHLVERDAAPLPETARDLPPGSYVLHTALAGRYPTTYPFVVHRGEHRAMRVVLPPEDAVPPGMAYVPAGRFYYGSADDETTRAMMSHQPIHEIELGAFLIAQTEVTREDYAAFPRAVALPERSGGLGVAEAAGEHLPVDGLSRDDAADFAAWLAASGRVPRARLCTDREWERAARGADDRRYPASTSPPSASDACVPAGAAGATPLGGPCPIGTHPGSRSPFGLDDVTGSVWEWTSSTPDVTQPRVGIIRGGGWNDRGLYLALPNRGLLAGSHRSRLYGIRICADLPP